MILYRSVFAVYACTIILMGSVSDQRKRVDDLVHLKETKEALAYLDWYLSLSVNKSIRDCAYKEARLYHLCTVQGASKIRQFNVARALLMQCATIPVPNNEDELWSVMCELSISYASIMDIVEGRLLLYDAVQEYKSKQREGGWSLSADTFAERLRAVVGREVAYILWIHTTTPITALCWCYAI